MTRLVIAALLASGCGGDCVDGTCADYDSAVAHAGPCKSAIHGGGCTFSYDGDGHIAHAACGSDDAVWTWTPSGVPQSIVTPAAQWTFGQDITVTGATMQTYDPSLFEFLPLVGDEVAHPAAELGRVRDGSTTYTWTAGVGQWTRTSSTGMSDVFAVDDQNRILGFDDTQYTYSGAHLVKVVAGGAVDTYRYDRAGNVASAELDGALEVFDYSCW